MDTDISVLHFLSSFWSSHGGSGGVLGWMGGLPRVLVLNRVSVEMMLRFTEGRGGGWGEGMFGGSERKGKTGVWR